MGQVGGSIKCSGKYTEIYFSFKITFPIWLPEHLISTISNIEPDGGMCMINNQAEVIEGTETQIQYKLTIGG